MPPKLYGHLFSSYTQKALIAFYAKAAPFDFRALVPDDEATQDAWRALWPIERFPVVEADGRVIVEATSIIEWLELHAPDGPKMIPADPKAALEVRMRDRIFDNYVMEPMQTIVFDRLRAEADRDPVGVAKAHDMLDRIYAWLDGEMASRVWATGDVFSMADCAAAPSLFYADWVHPLDGHDALLAYYLRLRKRPSFARCVADAGSTREMFPGGAPEDRLPA